MLSLIREQGKPPIPRPFAPIANAELPATVARHLAIRPVVVMFRDPAGSVASFETDRSNVLFARLTEAARVGEQVTHFSQAGLDLDGDSCSALNCYLRTGRAVGRGRLPFDRLPLTGTHRYAWAAFCEYLGLTFQ